MSESDWQELMVQWSKQLLDSSPAETVPAEMRARAYLGFDGARDEDIAAAESRLRISLPPSYVAFLRFSNGWGPTTHAINQIWRVQDVGWFSRRNPDWVRAYVQAGDPGEEMSNTEYYSYGEAAALAFKTSHLKCCLQITPVGDAAVYLLNPQANTPDGEWEAWFMANWLPGVHRYRSFRELMVAQYHSFVGVEWKQEEGLIGGLPQEYMGAPGSPKRKAVVAKPKREIATDDLVAAIGRPDLAMKLFRVRGDSWLMSNEEKAMRRLYRALAKRKEERVAKALRERLSLEGSWEMREEIISTLGELRDEASTELLFSRLGNPESFNEPLCVMHALKRIAPARLAELLLERVRKPDNDFMAVCGILAELRDLRAVPLLKRLLVEYEHETVTGPASQSLANFGKDGCSALLELCHHPDVAVRRRAAAPLYYCDDNRVEAELRRLLQDTDAAVRSSALSAIECLRPSQRTRK